MNQPPKSDPQPPQPKTPLDFDDDLEDHGSPAMAFGMIAAILVIVAFVTFGMIQRGKQEAHEAEAAAAAEEQQRAEEEAPPDSAALDSLARVARETREAREAEEAKAAADAAKAAQAAAQPAPVATITEPPKFGIQVGSFLFEDRANEVLSGLTSTAGVEGRIVPGDDGSFAVVLGPFDSRNAAEAKGTELLEKGAVTESRVVPIKN